MSNKYKNDLLELENCFSELKINDGDTKTSITQISRILTRMFHYKFNVSICKNTSGTFMGMTIYPSANTCERLISVIMEDKSHVDSVMEVWKKNDEWNIEIDSIALYDGNLNANPKELVAILLHEVGHVMYSNSIPQRLFDVLKYESIDIKMKTRNMFNNSKLRSLLVPSVIEACSLKFYKYLSENEEKDADKFVVNMGYGEHLNGFLEKLLRCRGNGYMTKTEKEADQDIKSVFLWGVENIDELKSRKTKLKYQLNAQILRTPSVFAKKMLTDIKDLFFGQGSGMRFNQLITEGHIMRFYDGWKRDAAQQVVLEFMGNASMGKLKKLDVHEVDYIRIQIDQIENHNDRIYILDVIHHYLDQIELYNEYIDMGKANKVPHTKKFIDGVEKELRELKAIVMKTKIPERQYGLFIKYPTGYEG